MATEKAMGEMSMNGFSGPVPPLQESGGLVVGPGGKKEGGRASIALPKLTNSESLAIQRAKKYAMEQSIKIVLTTKYPLRGYILGVLMLTTAWDQHCTGS